MVQLTTSKLTQSVVVAEKLLSDLGEESRGGRLVLTTLTGSSMDFEEIDQELSNQFPFIQKMDVSHNKLAHLPLSGFSFLTHVDASHNKLIHALPFKTTLCATPQSKEEITDTAQPDGDMHIGSVLRNANVSYNRIRSIGDISWHRRLVSLDLSHNKIVSIEGISELCMLQTINLSHNKIKHLRGLPAGLHIIIIDNNDIEDLSHTASLPYLECISAAANAVVTVEGLKSSAALTEVNLKGNRIASPEDVRFLESLFVRTANFSGNPMCAAALYRLRIIKHLQHLETLDTVAVTAEEKVKSRNAHGEDMDHRKETFASCYEESQPFVCHLQPFVPPDSGQAVRRASTLLVDSMLQLSVGEAAEIMK